MRPLQLSELDGILGLWWESDSRHLRQDSPVWVKNLATLAQADTISSEAVIDLVSPHFNVIKKELSSALCAVLEFSSMTDTQKKGIEKLKGELSSCEKVNVDFF